ncbi:hypothetical protein B4135_0121 [Caldibacillus debilis]|uniref:Uncharacterized protein n=1 Tax=Caldibacillus debilis TaxID=301148 RepID=A0A150M983_9BACI|nr:hypothetical protein B4135_0121 [Caldibacillus debilis]
MEKVKRPSLREKRISGDSVLFTYMGSGWTGVSANPMILFLEVLGCNG